MAARPLVKVLSRDVQGAQLAIDSLGALASHGERGQGVVRGEPGWFGLASAWWDWL